MLGPLARVAERPALVVAVAILLAVLVNAPYLGVGFCGDDFLLIQAFEEDPLPFSRWRGVWSHDDVDAFDHLWWRSPQMAGAFWRPLSSLLFEGSIRAFGRVAWHLHLFSLVLHGWVAGAVYLLVRRCVRNGAVLGLVAGLVFLLCEDHSMGVGWISTFTDMLSLALVMAGLLAHRAWLEGRRPAALIVSLLAMALALACKESAVLAPVLAAAMSAWMPGGREGPDLRWRGLGLADLGRRPLDWAPQATLVAVFLALYAGLDLGGMNNLMYLDPLARPADYLVHLLGHLPVMWLATISPLPPSLTMFYPEALAAVAVVGALSMAIWMALSWPLLRQPIFAWGLATYGLSLLPQMGADASERGLYQPFVGAAILLAGLLVCLRDNTVERRLRLGAWVVALGVVLPGALMAALYPFSYGPSLQAPERHTVTAIAPIEAAGAQTVLLVTTAGMMDTIYPSGILDYHLDETVEAWVLSSANAVWTIERVGTDSFILRADRRGWLTNFFARLVRTEEGFVPGTVFEAEPFVATIVETTPDGSDVLAVRFDVTRPDALLLHWTDGGYAPLELRSLPLGETAPLTDNADVWASML